MNWDDFRFVLALARKGSLTKAAGALAVNQTTVTRRLQSMQTDLGVELFEKLRHGFVPTQAGEEMIKLAEEMEEKIHALDERLANRDQQLSGPLRITFSEIIGGRWHWAFQAFARKHPQIDLELSLSNTNISLIQREADIAIRNVNRAPENLVGRKIGRTEYALYANRELVALHGQDYDRYPWIGWDSQSGAKMIDSWMYNNARGAKVVFRVDSLQVMIEAVSAGVGISFLPCLYADADPQLRRVRPVESGFGVDMWLLTHPDRRQIARVRAFMEYFTRICADHKDKFSGAASQTPPL